MNVARWRKRRDTETPGWVLEAWTAGRHDEIDPWLDELHGQDPDRWEVVLAELISTPAYTAGLF